MDDFVGTEVKIATKYNGTVTHTVVGIRGERWSGVKVYLVSCDTCSNDKELYPYGVFKIVKSSLKKGQCCCGCSSRQKTEYEQKIFLTRECEKRGYIFKGFTEGYNGVSTEFTFLCPTHKKDYTYKVSLFLNIHYGCEDCRYQVVGGRNTEGHIKDFMKTGRFDGCTFTRNNSRQTSEGSLRFFDMTCPICSSDEYVREGLCDGVFTAQMSSLKSGSIPCRCSSVFRWSKEQRVYQINKICDREDMVFTGWINGYENSFSIMKWSWSDGTKIIKSTTQVCDFMSRFLPKYQGRVNIQNRRY